MIFPGQHDRPGALPTGIRKDNGMETGKILMELRKEKNLGQKELVAYLSLSTGTISNYENGVHSPDLVTLCKLADYFDVTTDYLLNRTAYRYSAKKMDQHLSRDYTLSDVVDTVLTFNSVSIGHLMEYARFLQYEQEKGEPENGKRRKRNE